jgi:cellulose 1,4-beta-cellobiosidase
VRTHYENPFAGATRWYVNPKWAENARKDGGDQVAGYNTGIWLNRIADVEAFQGQKPKDGMGLRDHLDAALAQGADLIQLVLYSLPGRNCSAELSLGELDSTNEGMDQYKHQYIDRITRILGEAQYASLRVVAVVEYDSLSNLAAYTDDEYYPECGAVSYNKPWGYHEGIRYALTTLSALDNVHLYIDVSNSARLGWDLQFQNAVNLMVAVVQGGNFAQLKQGVSAPIPYTEHTLVGPTPAPGWGAINGFISNVADYVPLDEPFINPTAVLEGKPLRSALFYDWNPTISEHAFGNQWLKAIRQQGAPARLGMLVDTGRNGWGGPKRPTQTAKANTIDQRVNASRIDQRPHRSSWCNQPGGLGERPIANPKPGFHAYVWTKPPGESDGLSRADFEVDPAFNNRKYDEMCDPQGSNHFAEDAPTTAGRGVATGAMDNALHPGRWFSAGFRTLLENAYPKLQ